VTVDTNIAILRTISSSKQCPTLWIGIKKAPIWR